MFDGLFTAANGLVAGFRMWEVKDMDEAVEWVKRSPNPMLSRSEVEISLLFEYQDFGDAMTPELADQEDRMRKEIADRTIPTTPPARDAEKQPCRDQIQCGTVDVTTTVLSLNPSRSTAPLTLRWLCLIKHSGMTASSITPPDSSMSPVT